MKKKSQQKEFKTKEAYKQIKNRAVREMTVKLTHHLYNLGYNNVLSWKATVNGIECLRFNCDGNRYCFTLSTRMEPSYANTTERIDLSKKNKLARIALQFNIYRHLVLYTDGHTVAIDILNDSYDEEKQYSPKKTVKDGERDYIMKKVCAFTRFMKTELDFDAKWVFDGIVQSKPVKPDFSSPALF